MTPTYMKVESELIKFKKKSSPYRK